MLVMPACLWKGQCHNSLQLNCDRPINEPSLGNSHYIGHLRSVIRMQCGFLFLLRALNWKRERNQWRVVITMRGDRFGWKKKIYGGKKKKVTVYGRCKVAHMEELVCVCVCVVAKHTHTHMHKCRPWGLIDVSQRGCEWEPITFIMSNVVQKLASVLLCES